MSENEEARNREPRSENEPGNEHENFVPIRKYFPPNWLLIFALLVFIGIVTMFQSTEAIGDRVPVFDKALQNVVCVLSVFLVGLLILAWYLLSFPRSILFRLTTFLCLIGLAIGFFSMVEMKQNTGSIWPASFKWRWTLDHDEQIGKIDSISDKSVDLSYVTQEGEPDFNFSQFLGSGRDGSIDDVELDPDWKTNPPTIIWKQDIGAGWSGFTAANGYAVTLEQRADEEVTSCYDILTGEVVWFHAEKGVRHRTIPGGIGPRSTPTIDPESGYVYTIGGTGILLCLDGKDGSVVWRKEILKEVKSDEANELKLVAWGRSGSPLVAGEKLIVPGGGSDGTFDSLIAFDKTNGEEIWRGGTIQISYSSPMLMTINSLEIPYEHVVIVNESAVTGHDLETGEQLWTHERNGISNGQANVAQPVLYPDDQLLLTKGYGLGAELIKIEASSPEETRNPPVLTPKQIWKSKRYLRTKMSSAVRWGDYAFGLNEEVLECIDVINGKRMWRGERYGHGQLLLIGNHVLVLSEDGALALIAADSDEFREVARIEEVLQSITWNTICFHRFDNKWYLLIRNGEQAACLELATESDESPAT